MKKYYVAILLALSLPFSPTHANNDFANLSAEIKSVADNALNEMAMEVAIKINLSGTQSMLVQKMIKEALLVTLRIDPEKNKTQLKDSVDRFENILMGFQTDDEELKITQTQSKKVLAQMTKVAGLWDAFKPSIKKISSESDSATTKAIIDDMRAKSLPLLEASDQLGKMFGAYCGENLNELATIIHLTGQQRMLTQQMSIEFFSMAEDKAANQTALKKTLQQFDDILTQLVNGDKQQKIPATKDKVILEQLGKVRTQWELFKPILEAADTEQAALQKVATMNLTLLEAMNKVGEMHIR